MCYDVSFSTRYELITEYLPNIIIDKSIPLQFENQAHVLAQEFQPYPIVVFDNGNHYLKLFEWGLIADYMNTEEKIKQGRSFMCNAQSEKILGDQRSVWHKIRNNRCLIPVTGIYEHREIKGWKHKVPYHVRLKNEKMFFIPGLFNYAPFVDTETGEILGTFTLITRGANSVMRLIHNSGNNRNRMPLFLPFDLAIKWLEPDLSEDAMNDILKFEMPSDSLEYWPVYTIRSKTKLRPDAKSKFEPFYWEGLPQVIPDTQN